MTRRGGDALLRLCARAYPRSARERDGQPIVDLAAELAEGESSRLREAGGLLRAGAAARARAGLGDLASVPWRDARARLALPLAAALFALAAAYAGRSGIAYAWVGWSVAITLAAAAVTVAGAAAGHRWLTAAGAFAVAGMLGLDALRDHYGRGSRWSSEVGSALVDVLVMWLPAGLLMIACAGAVSRVPAQTGIRRAAWALLPGIVLLIVASEPTRVGVADRIVLFGGFLAATVLAGLALARRRTDAALSPLAALVAAAAAGPALWLVAAFLPPPADGMAPLALAYFAVGGAGACALLAGLARLGARNRA